MNAPDKRYRRNFVIALMLHAGAIAGLFGWEYFLSDVSFARPTGSEVIPAVLIGALPAGKGTGLGEYKAPEPPGPSAAAPAAAAPAPAAPAPAQNLAGDEAAAPEPKAVAQPKADPNEIAIPKKTAVKKPVAETKPTAVASTGKKPVTTSTSTAKAPASTGKTVASTGKATATTGTGHGSSAEEIKNRFEKMLSSSANGTARGDGKAAGGGTGTTGKIGLPNGTADGMVGGIGQGTPNWQYFQHVHDVLYEAWDQPGTALDKRLITTVALRIARDGSVTDAAVKIGSGNKLMDESVLAAVRKVPRLDPPPSILVRGEYAVIAVNFQVEG